MQDGVQSFISRMNEMGFDPVLDAKLIVYRVIPVDGAHAGCPVEIGVEVAELKEWPQIPPHWVHLPGSISFVRTNEDRSSKPGWLKHSRNVTGWGEAEPGISWISHLRAVLSEAT